jgi:hypothetical protein
VGLGLLGPAGVVSTGRAAYVLWAITRSSRWRVSTAVKGGSELLILVRDWRPLQ